VRLSACLYHYLNDAEVMPLLLSLQWWSCHARQGVGASRKAGPRHSLAVVALLHVGVEAKPSLPSLLLAFALTH